MSEAKEWIIQRCTQRWNGMELIYEDFPTSEGLMTRAKMTHVLDRVNRQNPDSEFKGHRVKCEGMVRCSCGRDHGLS